MNSECMITHDICWMLRNRRCSCGLSQRALGRILGISHGTLQSWECGRQRVCSRQHSRVLQQFLNGEFDGVISKVLSRPAEKRLPGLSGQCANQLIETYENLSECPVRQELLIRRIEHLVCENVSKYLADSAE